MACPNCGFVSDPMTGAIYDVTYPCPSCGQGGATTLAETVVARYLRADVHVPAEWFDTQKRKLADFLGMPVQGQDLAKVGQKIDDLANWIDQVPEELTRLSDNNPYAQREFSRLWEERLSANLKNCANYYRELDQTLQGGDTPFRVFVEESVRDSYKRAVKTLGSALENVPYFSKFKLGEIESKLRKAAPPEVQQAWGTMPPDASVLAYFKTVKAREKILRAVLEKSVSMSPLTTIDRLFAGLGKSEYFQPSFYEDRGIAREVAMGKAKVIIFDPARDPHIDAAVLKSFREAQGRLQRRGLGAVWYGPLYFVSTENGKLSAEEQAEAKAAGYDLRSFAGQYQPGSDQVWLHNYPGDGLVQTILHELGHRYWFRLLKPDQRAWFQDMVQTRAPKLDTDEARHKMVKEIDYIPGEKDEEGYAKPVLPVSQYGGTNIHEAFAEVFMHYTMGKHLDRDQIESLGQLLKMAAGKPPSQAQIDYAKRLLQQVGGEEPDWSSLDAIQISDLIDGLKKKRGRPVWYGNGQFSHWQKAASDVVAKYKSKKRVKTEDGDTMTVYEYSDRQIAQRHKDKAKRYDKLKGKIGDLRAKVKRDLKSSDPETMLTALAVALMDHTYERVGNDESAKDGHFGVTGWQKKHISFGKKTTINYVGKSGVKHKKEITDAGLKKALRDAYEAVEGDDTEILSWEGGKVSAEKVNAYLKDFGVTAKDIRGFHANSEMMDRLKAQRKGKLPEDKKEREKQLKEEFKKALEETADAVGHEAATLRSQYLVPGLEEDYLDNGKVDGSFTKTASSLAERVVGRWSMSGV